MNDACNFSDSGMFPKQPEELYEEYKRKKSNNNQINNQKIFRLCDMCKGKGNVIYGGMGDVFIYECPSCNGTGHKR